MGLILGVKEGATLFLNDEPVAVKSIIPHKTVTVHVGGKEFILTTVQSKEIYPSVFASVGLPKMNGTNTITRIVIEAPPDIVILREDLYRSGIDGRQKISIPVKHY